MTTPTNDRQRGIDIFDEALRLRDVRAYDAAAKMLRDVIAILASDDRLVLHSHLQLGHIAKQLNDDRQAEIEFRTATTIAPRSELASLGFFLALLRLERQTDALEEALRFVAQRESLGYREHFAGDAHRDDLTPIDRALAQQIRERIGWHRESQRALPSPAVGHTVRIADGADEDLRPGSLARLRKLEATTHAEVEFADGERASVPLSFLDHKDI